VSPLTLTVLGCDGSHAGPGGAGSGYLVRDWESRTALWLDAGPGTFVTAARWTLGFDRAPVPVLAAPGIRPRLTQDPDGVLDWREVGDGDVVGAGGLRLRFSRTDHPPVTLGVRIEGPSGVVGYSADSGPGWSLEALGRDLDLALCEATYTEDHETEHAIHMSGRQAGRSARQARARRLVVTHRWPTVAAVAVVAEAAAAFGGRVDAAEPGVGYSP
jgi:ribonuclease BN (tRNA processing enzyme)